MTERGDKRRKMKRKNWIKVKIDKVNEKKMMKCDEILESHAKDKNRECSSHTHTWVDKQTSRLKIEGNV